MEVECQEHRWAEEQTSVFEREWNRIFKSERKDTPTQALREHDESEAKTRNKQMRIKSRNTAASTKRGNFAERQAKRLVAGADRRLAQTLFVTWSVDEAAPKSHGIDASPNKSERKTNCGVAKRESAGQESAEEKKNRKKKRAAQKN